MSRQYRFKNTFKASELMELDMAHSDECAVLILRPSSFAVLGWLAEVVRWSSFIEDDLGLGVGDRSVDRLRQRIMDDMGYTYGLTDYLERMADAQEAIAANLQANDDGEWIGIAKILFDILPVLLAGTEASQEMALALAGIETAQSESVQLEMTNAGICCESVKEPNKKSLEAGQVRLSGTDCQPWNFVLDDALSNVVVSSEAAGEIIYQSNGAGGVTITSPPHIENGVYTLSLLVSVNDDAAQATVSGNFYDGTSVIPIPPQSGRDVVVTEELDFSSDDAVLQLQVTPPSGYEFKVSGEMCIDSSTGEKPVLIMALNENIGVVEEGSIMNTAQGWFINNAGLNDPTVIRADTDAAYPRVQLDWTRPIEGTMTVELWQGGTLIEERSLVESATNQVLDSLGNVWDTLKVRVNTVGGQLLGDLVVWAFTD